MKQSDGHLDLCLCLQPLPVRENPATLRFGFCKLLFFRQILPHFCRDLDSCGGKRARGVEGHCRFFLEVPE